MSQSRSGESGYQRKLRDPRWQKRRLQIFEAANWRCQDAGCRTGIHTLEAHHLYYIWGQDPWDYPLIAFLALCSDCHERRQQIERTLKMEMMKRLRDVPIGRLEKVAWFLIDEALKEQGVSA